MGSWYFFVSGFGRTWPSLLKLLAVQLQFINSSFFITGSTKPLFLVLCLLQLFSTYFVKRIHLLPFPPPSCASLDPLINPSDSCFQQLHNFRRVIWHMNQLVPSTCKVHENSKSSFQHFDRCPPNSLSSACNVPLIHVQCCSSREIYSKFQITTLQIQLETFRNSRTSFFFPLGFML